MKTNKRLKNGAFFRQVIASLIVISFILTSVVPPQVAVAASQNTLSYLPTPGTRIDVSEHYQPLTVRGITIHPKNPLKFDFIIHHGDDDLSRDQFATQSQKLIKYFLTSLTVPEDQQWVNLSPYEKDRMIPRTFGVTEMGRDLLSQDYLLKQISASLMYPEDRLGSSFWKKVKQEVYQRYGHTDIPMNTFNKVWIIPNQATIYESGQTAYILSSHLKVMLEQDYLALDMNTENSAYGFDQIPADDVTEVSELTAEIYKEIIIPALEEEVNHGETFANLRQIFSSMILATWYRMALEESFLAKVYADRGLVKGIDLEDRNEKEKIFDQYLAAFQKGVYNYVKEEYDPVMDEMMPRKYFSGGTRNILRQDINVVRPGSELGRRDQAALADLTGVTNNLSLVTTDLYDVGLGADDAVVRNVPALSKRDQAILGNTRPIPSSTPAENTHDIRSFVRGELRRAFGDKYILYEGGFSSLDIMPKGVNKRSAIKDVFAVNGELETALYFGDEFFITDRKTGNDTPILEARVDLAEEGKNVVIFSVDKDPNARTTEAKENSIWVGEGPEATKRVLDQINEAIAAGEKQVVIEGQGPDIGRNATIVIDTLVNKGIMLFDVDGTILEDKKEDFANQDAMRDTFAQSLRNIRAGIISGNSADEQSGRIASPLVDAGRDITNLTLYVNGGATRVNYDDAGRANKQNLADSIPEEDKARVQAIISRMARTNFGMDQYEVAAWEEWIGSRATPEGGFAGVSFTTAFGQTDFQPTIVTPGQLIEAKATANTAAKPLSVSNPFIEDRDGVQLSIKLLPSKLNIKEDDIPRRRMLQLLGSFDPIGQQRLDVSTIDTTKIVDFLVSYFTDQGLDPATVDQETFNRAFGTRPIVSIAGFGTRFSNFVHKGMAFSGLDRNNAMNALEGAFTTPGVQPLVFVGEKILGLLVKDEYLTGYAEGKSYFTISDGELSQIERDVLIDAEKYLDTDKVERYFGRGVNDLILAFIGPYGHGYNMKTAIQKINEKLPAESQVPYSQVAFGEMAESINPDKSNASLITYLRILEEEADAYQSSTDPNQRALKRPLAVAGGKMAQKEDGRRFTAASIKGKGNFFKMNGRLAAYTDWDQIPHKEASGDFDRVASEHGESQAALEAELAQIKEDITNPSEQREAIDALRARPEFRFFTFSDEGELFSQENLLALLDKLNEWHLLSPEERAYLTRHYAIVDNDGKTAELMISSNTGIFSNQAVLDVMAELDAEEVDQGYRPADGFFFDFQDQVSADDARKVGRWIGVDPKDNNTKTLAWNMFRILSDRYRTSNPDQTEAPIDLVFVGNAPSSIKNAEGAMAWANRYAQEFNISLGQSGLETAQESPIAEAIRDRQFDDAVTGLLALASEGTGYYRSEVRSLFKVFATETTQLRLFRVITAVSERLRSLLEKATDPEIRRNAQILLGINVQITSESIDAGYVGNIDEVATDNDYVDRLVQIYSEYRDSARQRGKTEYINVQLANTVRTRLNATQFLDNQVEPLLDKLATADGRYIAQISENPEAARDVIRVRNLLSLVANGTKDESYIEALQNLSRNIALGLLLLSEKEGESISSLIPKGEGFANGAQNVKPDRKAVLITGGTAVGTLWAKSLALTDGFQRVDVTGIVGNVDDGGSSYDIVNILNQAGYGVVPPPGDKINTLQGFMTSDKREYLMGDSGRLPKDDAAPDTMAEGTMDKVLATLTEFDTVDRIETDFFYFARVLLSAARNVDEINDEIMTNVEARLKREQDRTLNESDLAEMRAKRTIRTSGASIRNLYVLGFLREFGVIGQPTNQRNQERIDVEGYEKALKALTAAANVHNTFVTVSSFDPKTVYAQYKGYTMMLKDGEGNTLPVVIEEEADSTITIRIPRTVVDGVVYEEVEKKLKVGKLVNLDRITHGEGEEHHPVFNALTEKARVKNVDGRAQIFIAGTTWQIDDVDLDDGRLVKVGEGKDQRDVIPMSNDGTGRERQYEGTDKKNPMFRLEAESGYTDVYFRGRLVKMQTNITETVNFSKIVRVGFLEGGLGLKGEVPDQLRQQKANDSAMQRIRQADKGDVVIIGPGSFYTSILPHFLVDGMGRELASAKERGVNIILTLNATRDNETLNLSVFEMLNILEDAANSGLRMDDMISHIIAVEDYEFPQAITDQLNPVVDADIRTDPRASSSAAKKNRGAMTLSRAQLDRIQGHWKNLEVFRLQDALTLVATKSRDSAGKKSYRIVHDVKVIADALDEISPSVASQGVKAERLATQERVRGVVLKDAPKTDKALLATATSIERPDEVGGIDFNPALLDLQIKRDGAGIPLPYNQQPMSEIQINGFLPVIINITPVTNLPLLLGLDTQSPDNVAQGTNTIVTDQLGYFDSEVGHDALLARAMQN